MLILLIGGQDLFIPLTRTGDSSLLRQQLVVKQLENQFLRCEITAQR